MRRTLAAGGVAATPRSLAAWTPARAGAGPASAVHLERALDELMAVRNRQNELVQFISSRQER